MVNHCIAGIKVCSGKESPMVRILFVCTGNICRSPTAEGVFRHLVAEAGLADRIATDSVGTHDYHVGEAPDPRAIEAAARRGVDICDLRARKLHRRDLDDFDLILVMDGGHRRLVAAQAPPPARGKIHLFLDTTPEAGRRSEGHTSALQSLMRITT